jgi:hypothetical protein
MKMKTIQSCLAGILFITLVNACTKSDTTSIDPVTSYKLKLKGSVKACNGSNLTNGEVVILSDYGNMSLHITNGSFDTTLQSNTKFDSVIVWAIDLNALTVSDTLKIRVSVDSINFGSISACARNVDEYIKCKISTDEFVFVPTLYDSLRAGGWDTLSAPTTYFYRSDAHLINSTFYRMQFNGMSTGTFGMNWNSTFMMGRYYSFNMPNTGTVTYTTYGTIGNYIKGTLNIPFTNNNDGLNYLLTGSFQVRRDY